MQKTVGSNTYDARVYPNFTAYMNGVLVAFWEPQLVVADNALETAYESYAKAYELDPKSASKVKEGIESIANEFRKNADNFFALQNYAKTGYSFEKSYDVLLHPAVNSIDTVSLYYAGMFYTFANEFDKGAELLEKALGYGYEADGDTYYYLYFCYVGREQNEKAKDILTEGIKKYPGNTRIVEGLVGIYSVVEGSDPSDIIPLVMESVEKEPDNALLWSGLGGIYLKLKDFPQAISAYQQALDIAPDDFYNQFRRGYTAIE